MIRRAVVLIFAVSSVLIAWAPSEAASNTRIEAVYDLARCAASDCGPSLPSGAVVRGVRVDVASQSATGLSYLRLEALGGGDTQWQCIHRWDAAGSHNFTGRTDWQTSNWPFPGAYSGCTEDTPHRHGEATLNASYTLRVVAVDGAAGQEDVSPEFVVKLDNPPQAPLWRGEPSVSGTQVTLRWYRGGEVDLDEYHIRRVDATGRTTTTAVSASQPARTTGCLAEKEATFTCTQAAGSGRTRFTVVSLRPSFSSSARCKTTSARCISSAPAPAKTVTIAGGAKAGVPPTMTTSAEPTRATEPSAPATSSPAPGASPSSPSPGPVAAPRDEPRGSRAVPLVLAVLVLAGVSGTFLRLRRATS